MDEPAERVPLTYNRLNGVTAAMWREGDVVHKVLSPPSTLQPAVAPWAASENPRHWNYWRREALAYEAGLPSRLGLNAPRLIETTPVDGGGIRLTIDAIDGRTAGELGVDDLERVAFLLGASQGDADRQPAEAWLSRGFLRDYSSTRRADFAFLYDHERWSEALAAGFLTDHDRQSLIRMHEERGRLLSIMEALPRTIAHLDMWPNNVIVPPNADPVFIDWSFVGHGALGEDIGNLIPDSIFDLQLPVAALSDLADRLPNAYLAGLRSSGWTGDERLVRLGILASAVKYDWLTARTLELASAAEHSAYGGAEVDSAELLAARWAGLALCAAWSAEALQVGADLGFLSYPAP